MHTGTVNFTAKTSGLKAEAFSVKSPHPNIVDLVCAISDEGRITLDVSLDEVFYEDWPVQEIVQEVQQFLDVLSFEFNCPISSVREYGFSLKQNDGSGMSHVSSSLVMMWDVVSETLVPGEQSIQRLKQRYSDFRQSAALRLYSSAIQQEDPVARFMFLYNIILTLSGDSQTAADNNILSVAPETAQTPSPINQNAQETIYTRLRNEIAHNRVGADYAATSSEVTQQVAVLGRITKQLVLNNG